MPAYIVKTSDGYLYPTDDGDVAWTEDEDRAGHFDGMDEAHSTAQVLGYGAGSYDVISVPSDDAA